VKITPQILHNIVIDNIYPRKVVYLGGVPFYIQLSPDDIDSFHSKFEYLYKYVSARGIDGNIYKGKELINSLPVSLARILEYECSIFQDTICTEIMYALENWCNTSPDSQNLWTVFKSTSPELVLVIPDDNKLSIFQQAWVIYNTINDKRDRNTFIGSVLDALYPWLNPEMWSKMQDAQKTRRENWKFDSDEFDKRLQEKAERIANEKLKNIPDEEPDTIELEDNIHG